MSDAGLPATMHIGELAERAGMSLRTIRHYDEVGLLVPSGRTTGGFRVYTGDDLERLLVIRRMKPLGFTLDEMAELLRVVDGLRDADPDDARTRAARLETTPGLATRSSSSVPAWRRSSSGR